MLEGEVTFRVAGENHIGGPGAFVSFPRGIPHTFGLNSSTARFLLMTTPGGFEGVFERALTAYEWKWLDPIPEDAANPGAQAQAAGIFSWSPG
jgi:hypothetical protein